jgi:hypothetical protein
MTISMYGACVPALRQMLVNMLAWIDKADAHAQARRFPADNYLGLRLAPDMLPFASQIRIACDTAKRGVARLTGLEMPVHADDETTLAQLRARIESVVAILDGVAAEAFDGSEERAIEVPQRNREPLKFTGENYLRHYLLPNFYFHATTAYALLRHAGVELGKADYLRGG